eukprot:7219873-Pyramimonas_sp.AAC.4
MLRTTILNSAYLVPARTTQVTCEDMSAPLHVSLNRGKCNATTLSPVGRPWNTGVSLEAAVVLTLQEGASRRDNVLVRVFTVSSCPGLTDTATLNVKWQGCPNYLDTVEIDWQMQFTRRNVEVVLCTVRVRTKKLM